jgi:hypothetical protein
MKTGREGRVCDRVPEPVFPDGSKARLGETGPKKYSFELETRLGTARYSVS